MPDSSSPLRIGLAGYGTVGSGLARIIESNSDLIKARAGRDVRITTILVRDTTRVRAVPYPAGVKLTDNMDDLINSQDVDVVVEVIGGTDSAYTLIKKALYAGKHVVTANKALLAETGNELFALAAEKNLHLCFEASVCGGIPIVETLKNGLAANNISSVIGILNGTSNYILSEMSTKGLNFADALRDAQQLGYAEADPTFDIEGIDAAHKLALLIRLAWGVEYPFAAIKTRGISEVNPLDISYARAFGYRIKLIAQAKMYENGLEAAVFPAFVHETYLLSRVGGAYNAVRIHGDAIGSVFLHGKGAGDMPTGSSVAADILTIARGGKVNNTGFANLPGKATLLPSADCRSPFYIRLLLTDEPGVLRDVAAAMADNNISVAQAIQKRPSGMTQEERNSMDKVPFTLMTHEARVTDVKNALQQLAASTMVHEQPVYYRVLAKQDGKG